MFLCICGFGTLAVSTWLPNPVSLQLLACYCACQHLAFSQPFGAAVGLLLWLSALSLLTTFLCSYWLATVAVST